MSDAMQLVEKAARALAQARGGEWDALPPEDRRLLRRDVRAVVLALRDPDAAMAEAGAEIVGNVGPGESRAAHLNDAVNTWRFMVDALLDEAR